MSLIISVAVAVVAVLAAMLVASLFADRDTPDQFPDDAWWYHAEDGPDGSDQWDQPR